MLQLRNKVVDKLAIKILLDEPIEKDTNPLNTYETINIKIMMVKKVHKMESKRKKMIKHLEGTFGKGKDKRSDEEEEYIEE